MASAVSKEVFSGERALFSARDLVVTDSIFEDGESPLKEASGIELERCSFKWKYPLWYCRDVTVRKSSWLETARAGVWYSRRISLEDCVVEAPKNFRRCDGIRMKGLSLTNAAETLWNCTDVQLSDVCVKGDYFAMNSARMRVDGLSLTGGYAFDGVKDSEFRNLHLITKDVFWNSENVTVRDSFISSEYIGWNSKNLSFVNCVIESLQGLCYIENLVMRGCTLLNTNLAFEYSTVDVEVVGGIDSVKNPSGGVIRADSIGEVILDPSEVDPSKTEILTKDREPTLRRVV